MADFETGQRVCVIGLGTANLVHSHPLIVKITPKQLVTETQYKGRKIERRYWRATLREVGAYEYGGTTIHATCQRRDTQKGQS